MQFDPIEERGNVMTKLDFMQMDAFKELGNIGAGHAATALSQLINDTVYVDIPEAKFLPVSAIIEVLGKEEQMVAGLFQKIYGKVTGSIIIIFPKETAFSMIDLIIGRRPGETKIIGPMEVSVLEEMGNILTGSYLTALSQMTGLLLLPSVPKSVIDVLDKVIEAILSDLGQIGEYILFIETKLRLKTADLQGRIFFVPESNSLKTILEAMGLG